MRNSERVTSVKSELLDIHMNLEVTRHAQRSRSAAQRSLRARRGIELHNEIKQLERDINDLDLIDDEKH